MDSLDQNTIPNSQPVSTTPKWVIIVLLLIFPPIAFYFMWKEKLYHRWFAYLLIFVGGLTSILGIIQILFVKPKLLELYKDFNSKVLPTHSVTTYILITIGIVEITYGIYLKNKLKIESTQKKLLVTAVGFLLISYLLGGYLQAQSVLSVITPLYNLTNEIDSTTSITGLPTNSLKDKSGNITPSYSEPETFPLPTPFFPNFE